MVSKEIRLIDEKGQQLGVYSFEQASQIATEKGFDLILITDKVSPPIYRLGDYGKLKYQQEKELKKENCKRSRLPKNPFA